MRDILDRLKQLEESQTEPSSPQIGDEFGLSFSDDLEISTTITDVLEDGIVVDVDDEALAHIQENGAFLYDGEIVEEELSETEAQKGLDGKRCWKGYKRMGTKMKGGKRVDNCVKVGEGIEEADEGKDRDSVRPEMVKSVAEKIKAKHEEDLKTYNDRYEEVVQQLKSSGVTDPKEIEREIDDMDDDILSYYYKPDIEGKIEVMDSVLELGPDADGHDIVDVVHNNGMDTSPREEIADQFQNELKKADPETFKKLYGNTTTLSDINDEGIEEADVDTGEVEFRPETGKEKYPAGYASDGAKIMHIVNDLMMRIKDENLWDQTMKSLNDLENGKGTKQDIQNVMKIYNSAKKQGLTQKYDDAVEKGVQGWDDPEAKEESSELDRIRQLSGIQTEGHGPEVDNFLQKLAAMDDDQEKYETAEKAYAGKFGPKIQQAIEDMYNEAKKSVGDMDDIMDDVLDMIEKDYGTEKTKYSIDDLKDVRNQLASRTDVLTKMGKEESVTSEAEYQGRKVSLGKPTRGDVKKFKVYVRDPKTGNVKKVNFGDPNMKIKKSNPARRKSFRARHNCDNPGPRTKARYWSCRKW